MGVLSRFAVWFMAVLLLAGIAISQGSQSGGISGSVKDATGAAIGGATVTITNNATNNVERSVVTTNEGLFSVTLLPPGDYTVSVKAQGFRAYSAQVAVLLNTTARFDAALQVGATTEVVEVTAGAVTVNTESAVTGTPIDSATLKALPLPVPNFMFLLSLSAGTSGEMPDVRAANRGIVDINVNGQRTSNNSVSLEGINVNDFNLAHFDTVPLPNPHTIEEFNVATSLYDASSGTKGGGALGLVFKSGTKDWHGEAYWQHRNDFLNANDWFTNEVGNPRGKFLQNVLGFSGSGPMPFLGGNWFGNVQGLRARNAVSTASLTNVNTPIFNTNPDGTTSAALIASTPGITGVTTVDPTALNILNLKNNYYGGTFLIPRVGQPGCVQSAAATATTPANLKCVFSKVAPVADTQYVISYDRPFFSGKSKVSGRWFYDNGNTNAPFGTASALAFPQSVIQNNRFMTLSHTQEISNRQLNVFRFGFSRFLSTFAPNDIASLSDIGASRPNSGTVPGIYQVAVTGAFSFGTGVNDERGTVSNSFDYNDTWSIVLGKHTLKAGGGATRYQLNRFNRFAIRGALGFNNIKDFLAGQIDTLQAASGDPQRYFRATDYGTFIQDDYKILTNLTLNLGLRWDSFEFSHDLLERTTIFDPSLVPKSDPFLFASDINLPGLTGTPGVGSCGSPQCRTNNNFGPRAGFSWDPFHDHKTVVRGGYGIYFQRLSNQNFLQGSLGPPFFVQIVQNTPGTSLANPLPGQPGSGAVATAFIPSNSHFAGVGTPAAGVINGDPNDPKNFPLFKNDQGVYCAGFAPTGTATSAQASNCSINLASFSSVPPNAKAPYNQQWNLGIQREIGKGWTLETDYVGSHYLRGLGIFEPFMAAVVGPSNPINLTDSNGVNYTINTNTVNNEPLRVSALGLSRRKGARVDGNVGFAIYHSAQFTLSHRFQKGLYFQSAYTWSKEIDNVSGSQSTDELNATQAGQLGAALANFGNKNPALNRSIGDFDRRHRLVLSYVYDLPIPKGGIWGTQAFQGWTISGINTYQSGLPFSVTDAFGGRAFGGGTSTGTLLCPSISDAYTPGSVQSQIENGLGYLNKVCFAPAPVVANGPAGLTNPATATTPTGFGTIPRNAFRGPFQQNWDLALAKHFRLHERNSLDFRVDAFNVLNHPSFRQPSSVGITAPSTFGQITSTVNPPRLMQLNVQYSF
ncbi:MAG TPA: carboxypeptidase-like regulatory domain-containing protein [Candidatus Angelobacter sp.]|nr:carboxypeptidase-like regulatory domain-containing protein [Candidatus Angelobacter sp.]